MTAERGKLPELLAPAGGWDALVAAAQNGADAVYFGAKRFSARSGAKNFSDEELARAARYCRERGIKAYLAVNTLVRDREMPEFARLISLAAGAGVSAVILQDLGAARVSKQVAPDLPRHASTQMSVHSADGARRLFESGFSRIILARELSKAEISQIARSCGGELEIFVHGALCISYSGQCLMSSMIGGRSGNRGDCAQPCRLPYRIGERGGFFLSPKDLSLIGHIKDAAALGASSLKIEGRMKSAAYVGAVTAVFREVLDRGFAKDEDIKRLKAAFCRGEDFTGAYYAGETGARMMCPAPPDNIKIKAPPRAGAYAKGGERGRIFVDAKLSGETLILTDTDGNIAGASAAADGPPISPERAAEQISKLGGTPFVIKEAVAEAAPFKISTLNRLRRQAAAKLLELRGLPPAQRVYPYIGERAEGIRPPGGAQITASVATAEQARAAIDGGIRRVYLPIELILEAGDMASECYALLPVIIKDGEREEIRKMLGGARVRGVAAGSVSGLSLAREAGYEARGAFGLNITNLPAVLAHRDLGFSSAFLSPELSAGAVRDIALGAPIECECAIYGRVTLMINENCAIKAAGACGRAGEIVDRRGARFPVLPAAGGFRSRIINSRPLYMADRLSEIFPAMGQLIFTVETRAQTERIIDEYMGRREPSLPEEFTRGYYRGRK